MLAFFYALGKVAAVFAALMILALAAVLVALYVMARGTTRFLAAELHR